MSSPAASNPDVLSLRERVDTNAERFSAKNLATILDWETVSLGDFLGGVEKVRPRPATPHARSESRHTGCRNPVESRLPPSSLHESLQRGAAAAAAAEAPPSMHFFVSIPDDLL